MPAPHPLPETAPVVIVGAGPAGLAAAVALAAAGTRAVVLDRQAEGANTSRACVVHARTLEVLAELGIVEELHRQGIVVPTFTVRDRGMTLATIRFGNLPTPYPYTLMVPQNVTEAVLLDRLHALGGTVHRPYEVTGVTDDGTAAVVTYTGPSGDTGTIRARYVVGADGMHSAVRDHAAIGFTGDSYPTSFVLADVRMRWPIPREQVTLHLSPEGVMVVAPLPDENGDRFRVVATVPQAPEHPGVGDVQAVLDTRGPGGGAAQVTDISWSSRFRVHHRVADRYRAGRVFLAGDAAHVHSPAGGQGMNTGIQDAVFLAHLLARAAAGEPDSILDTYETVRRPVALGVVSFTDRMTRMATLRPLPARAVRNAALLAVGRVPAVRSRLAFQLAELPAR